MLTTAQQKLRAGRLTASRVACLMQGDAKAIHQLWLEMTGQAEEEDLSDVWAVQLGSVTEQLNLDWFEKKKGVLAGRRGEVVIHGSHSWAACTLDGFVNDPHGPYPVEAKHVMGSQPIEMTLERYMPQLHWQMLITGCARVALSVIQGAREPVIEWIGYDNAYGDELWDRAESFITHVWDMAVPIQLMPVKAPINAKRELDMSGDELWQRYARQWLQTRGAAESAAEAEKTLKALVPDDVWKAYGLGVRITRDRASRMSLRKDDNA